MSSSKIGNSCDFVPIFSFISVGLVITSIIELFGISLIIPIVYTLTSDNFYFEIVKFLSVYDINNLSKNEILQFSLILSINNW